MSPYDEFASSFIVSVKRLNKKVPSAKEDHKEASEFFQRHTARHQRLSKCEQNHK